MIAFGDAFGCKILLSLAAVDFMACVSAIKLSKGSGVTGSLDSTGLMVSTASLECAAVLTGRERLDRNDGGLKVVGVEAGAASGEVILAGEPCSLSSGDSRPEELSDINFTLEN